MRKRLSPEIIKAMLRDKFGSLLEFERAYDLRPNSAVDALRGRTKGNATVEAMAKALGESVESIRQPKKPARAGKSGHHSSIKMDSHRLNAGAE